MNNLQDSLRTRLICVCRIFAKSAFDIPPHRRPRIGASIAQAVPLEHIPTLIEVFLEWWDFKTLFFSLINLYKSLFPIFTRNRESLVHFGLVRVSKNVTIFCAPESQRISQIYFSKKDKHIQFLCSVAEDLFRV